MIPRSIRSLLCLTLIVLCLAGRQSVAGPQDDSLTRDEAAIARLIIGLSSDKADAREAAAASLRAIVAKYDSGTSDIRDKDAGRARWQKKIDRTHPGMAEADVDKILPPDKVASGAMEIGSGDSHDETYRLDDHWMIGVSYRNSGGLLGTPELRRSERRAGHPRPPHFTGPLDKLVCERPEGRRDPAA